MEEELVKGVNASTCNVCKTLKPLDAFCKASDNKSGVQYTCKACQKIYRENNKERKKAVNAKWREENKERVAEVARAYSLKNKAAIKQYKDDYYARNKEVEQQKGREYYQANKHEITARHLKYAENNRPAFNATAAKRRAAKKSRTPCWLTEQDLSDIEDFYILAKALEEVTGEVYHVDHIIPLQGDLVSGLHCPANLQILTAFENISKGNKYTIE